MAIAIASSGTVAVTATSTTLTVALPPGIAANDICLWHTHTQKSTLAHVYPGGWTVVGPILNELLSSRTMQLSFAWQRMAGGESGNVAVSHGGNSTAVLMSAISLWRGVSTNGNPYSTQVSTVANSSIYNTKGLTLSDTNHVCVYLMSNADDAAAMTGLSSQIGMEAITQAYNTESALGNGAILAMEYAQATSSGVVQGGTCRMATVEIWSAFEIALVASTEVAATYDAPVSFSLMGVQ
jgi:hypothetical protein